tara:strand:- start:183 stop:605 length:423 start_codon:yes stop_codon:yes gene_type:complete
VWKILGCTKSILTYANYAGPRGLTDPRIGTAIGVCLCDASAATPLALRCHTEIFQMATVGIVQAATGDIQRLTSGGRRVALVNGARVAIVTCIVIGTTPLHRLMHATSSIATIGGTWVAIIAVQVVYTTSIPGDMGTNTG